MQSSNIDDKKFTSTPINQNNFNFNSNTNDNMEMNRNNNINNQLPSYELILAKMKSLIKKYLDLNLYENALFYAEKCLNFSLNHDLISLSENIYDLAHCLYLNKEYSRCVNLIQKYNMTYYNLNFLILLGQSLYNCEDYESVITFLEKDQITFESNSTNSIINKEEINLLNSIKHLLIAKAYEMQENKQPAIKNYILSLKYDPFNIESFNILIEHQLLNLENKNDLLNELLNIFTNDNRWLYDYYKSKIDDNIYMTDYSDIELNDEKSNIIDILYKNNDQDLMKMEAEKFFIARDYENCYKKLKKISEEDFYNLNIVPIFCNCLIELNNITELYSLAFKLANNVSEKYISWYAVGCYYYLIKKYEMARKYFIKCNQLNKNFPESLIGIGNCYALQDESDQALCSYRNALRIFPGCHYANLYIGMEFIRTNNYKTANLNFANALLLCNKDPLIYNEMGVVFFKLKKYENAEKYFKDGINLCNEDRSTCLQCLLLNLGHTYRKMRKFFEAVYCYMKLYFIDSKNTDVLNSIGLCMCLIGDNSKALDYFHRANFVKSSDEFTTEMINRCIGDLFVE